MKWFLMVLFFSSPLKADYIFSYSKSLLLEEEVNGFEYSTQTRDSLRLGYKKKTETYLLEHNFFSKTTNNGNSSIKNKSIEWLLWYLKEYEIIKWNQWIAEYGFALGAQWAKITTTLSGSSRSDTSDPDISLGLGVGARKNLYKALWYGFQVRLLYSPAYASQPTAELSFLQLSLYW